MADITDGKWRCLACECLNDMKDEQCVDCFSFQPKKVVSDDKLDTIEGKWKCIACWAFNEMKEDACIECFGPKPERLIYDESQRVYVSEHDNITFNEDCGHCKCKPGYICIYHAFNEDERYVISDF